MNTTDNIGILEILHREIEPDVYLEIGIELTKTINMSKNIAIGVAPHPALNGLVNDNIEIVSQSSTSFFLNNDLLRHTAGRPIDLAYLSGIHLFEDALQSFMHIEKHSHEATIVCINNVLPQTVRMANREPQADGWTGDVFGVVFALREHRPDLFLTVLNAAPAGMLVVTNLNPSDTTLETQFSKIKSKHFQFSYQKIHDRQSEIMKSTEFSRIFVDYLKLNALIKSQRRTMRRIERILRSDTRVQLGGTRASLGGYNEH